MKLIVDSGSTKTAWRVQLSPVMCFDIFTAGINPVRDDEASMYQVIEEASSRIGSELVLGRASSLASGTTFSHVHFYGAGCLPNFTAPLIRLLKQAFPSAIVEVESDLLGAARLNYLSIDTVTIITNLDNNAVTVLERMQENVSFFRLSSLCTDFCGFNTVVSTVT